MSLIIGGKTIDSIYAGEKQIVEMYAGNRLIYGKNNSGGDDWADIEIDPTYNYFVFDTTLDTLSTPTITLQRYSDQNWGELSYDYGLTDWGDGTIDSKESHTYSKDGIYTVKTRYRLSNDSRYRTQAHRMLIRCLNLNNNIESKTYTFYGCNNLQSIGKSFDMSKVKTMYGMFWNCESLTSLDLSDWDVSSLGFRGGDSDYWQEANLTGTSYMFYGCCALVSLDLSGWDMRNVTNTYNMFGGCLLLNRLKLSGCPDDTIILLASLLPKPENNDGIIYVDNIKDTYPPVNGWIYYMQQ